VKGESPAPTPPRAHAVTLCTQSISAHTSVSPGGWDPENNFLNQDDDEHDIGAAGVRSFTLQGHALPGDPCTHRPTPLTRGPLPEDVRMQGTTPEDRGPLRHDSTLFRDEPPVERLVTRVKTEHQQVAEESTLEKDIDEIINRRFQKVFDRTRAELLKMSDPAAPVTPQVSLVSNNNSDDDDDLDGSDDDLDTPQHARQEHTLSRLAGAEREVEDHYASQDYGDLTNKAPPQLPLRLQEPSVAPKAAQPAMTTATTTTYMKEPAPLRIASLGIDATDEISRPGPTPTRRARPPTDFSDRYAFHDTRSVTPQVMTATAYDDEELNKLEEIDDEWLKMAGIRRPSPSPTSRSTPSTTPQVALVSHHDDNDDFDGNDNYAYIEPRDGEELDAIEDFDDQGPTTSCTTSPVTPKTSAISSATIATTAKAAVQTATLDGEPHSLRLILTGAAEHLGYGRAEHIGGRGQVSTSSPTPSTPSTTSAEVAGGTPSARQTPDITLHVTAPPAAATTAAAAGAGTGAEETLRLDSIRTDVAAEIDFRGTLSITPLVATVSDHDDDDDSDGDDICQDVPRRLQDIAPTAERPLRTAQSVTVTATLVQISRSPKDRKSRLGLVGIDDRAHIRLKGDTPMIDEPSMDNLAIDPEGKFAGATTSSDAASSEKQISTSTPRATPTSDDGEFDGNDIHAERFREQDLRRASPRGPVRFQGTAPVASRDRHGLTLAEKFGSSHSGPPVDTNDDDIGGLNDSDTPLVTTASATTAMTTMIAGVRVTLRYVPIGADAPADTSEQKMPEAIPLRFEGALPRTSDSELQGTARLTAAVEPQNTSIRLELLQLALRGCVTHQRRTLPIGPTTDDDGDDDYDGDDTHADDHSNHTLSRVADHEHDDKDLYTLPGSRAAGGSQDQYALQQLIDPDAEARRTSRSTGREQEPTEASPWLSLRFQGAEPRAEYPKRTAQSAVATTLAQDYALRLGLSRTDDRVHSREQELARTSSLPPLRFLSSTPRVSANPKNILDHGPKRAKSTPLATSDPNDKIDDGDDYDGDDTELITPPHALRLTAVTGARKDSFVRLDMTRLQAADHKSEDLRGPTPTDDPGLTIEGDDETTSTFSAPATAAAHTAATATMHAGIRFFRTGSAAKDASEPQPHEASPRVQLRFQEHKPGSEGHHGDGTEAHPADEIHTPLRRNIAGGPEGHYALQSIIDEGSEGIRDDRSIDDEPQETYAFDPHKGNHFTPPGADETSKTANSQALRRVDIQKRAVDGQRSTHRRRSKDPRTTTLPMPNHDIEREAVSNRHTPSSLPVGTTSADIMLAAAKLIVTLFIATTRTAADSMSYAGISSSDSARQEALPQHRIRFQETLLAVSGLKDHTATTPYAYLDDVTKNKLVKPQRRNGDIRISTLPAAQQTSSFDYTSGPFRGDNFTLPGAETADKSADSEAMQHVDFHTLPLYHIARGAVRRDRLTPPMFTVGTNSADITLAVTTPSVTSTASAGTAAMTAMKAHTFSGLGAGSELTTSPSYAFLIETSKNEPRRQSEDTRLSTPAPVPSQMNDFDFTPRPPAKRHDIYDYKGDNDDGTSPAYAFHCPKSQPKMIDTPAPTLTNQRKGEDERRGRRTDNDAWWYDGNKTPPHLRLRRFQGFLENDASHACSGGPTDDDDKHAWNFTLPEIEEPIASDTVIRLLPVRVVADMHSVLHVRLDRKKNRNIVRLAETKYTEMHFAKHTPSKTGHRGSDGDDIDGHGRHDLQPTPCTPCPSESRKDAEGWSTDTLRPTHHTSHELPAENVTYALPVTPPLSRNCSAHCCWTSGRGAEKNSKAIRIVGTDNGSDSNGGGDIYNSSRGYALHFPGDDDDRNARDRGQGIFTSALVTSTRSPEEDETAEELCATLSPAHHEVPKTRNFEYALHCTSSFCHCESVPFRTSAGILTGGGALQKCEALRLLVLDGLSNADGNSDGARDSSTCARHRYASQGHPVAPAAARITLPDLGMNDDVDTDDADDQDAGDCDDLDGDTFRGNEYAYSDPGDGDVDSQSQCRSHSPCRYASRFTPLPAAEASQDPARLPEDTSGRRRHQVAKPYASSAAGKGGRRRRKDGRRIVYACRLRLELRLGHRCSVSLTPHRTHDLQLGSRGDRDCERRFRCVFSFNLTGRRFAGIGCTIAKPM
jgi:hypothetical protein